MQTTICGGFLLTGALCCVLGTMGLFGDLKLLFAFKHLLSVWQEESKNVDWKTVLLNGLKHFALSAGAVIGGAILTWLLNDNALATLLLQAGLPGKLAVALIPVLHALLAMIQKKWFSQPAQ